MADHPGKRLPVLGRAETAASAEEPAEVVSRRQALSLMGASLALAGLTGCAQKPPEKIVPYVRQPEDVVHGRPLLYATSMVHAGYATGLLVRSVLGRPVKVEGNPEHPASLGATDAQAQASPLSLYDPGRAQVIRRLGRITTWTSFTAELGAVIAAQRGSGGAGIRILTEAVTSPSLAGQIAAFRGDFPEARWIQYEPAGNHHTRAGTVRAFGAPREVRLDLTAADVIVTLDSDFLAYGPGNLRYARDFSRRRAVADSGALGHASVGRGELPPSPRMNRLYCIESSPTCTGSLADHRLAVRPGEVGAIAAGLAVALGVLPEGAPRAALSPAVSQWVAALARDLQRNRGRCLVVAGEPAQPAVHALAIAMNDALGNTGATVFYTDPVVVRPLDQIAELRALTLDLKAGRVALLAVLGGNPVYTAPRDLDFPSAILGASLCLHLALHDDETSELCHYNIPEAHYLESWGDARAFDGTLSLTQPLIDPLHGGRSALELVAAMRGRPAASGLELVRAYWQSTLDPARFEAQWRKALEDGFLAGSAFAPVPSPLAAGVATAAAADIAAVSHSPDGYDLAFRPDPTIDDGRHAHNGWLQELPKPYTKLTWDNAVLMSPRSAEELGVATGDMIEMASDGMTVTGPAYLLPHHPDGSFTAHLGYGRRRAGAASGLGFDAYRLRTSAAPWDVRGVLVRKTGAHYPLAVTQGHFAIEGRAHARSTTLQALVADPRVVLEMATLPPRPLSLFPAWKYQGRQWAMAIDMGACTGCSACVVACQAENNIPIVGKDQVIARREMHWLRIDQYYEDSPRPGVINQPMMCVHCEAAPCEYVCPVAATTHSADGLNEMTYNRCVGTRYCSNNCPYKVRRFNFFQYANPEPEVLHLLRNPDVTVRSRGVMEKCTYCVQRIRGAEIDSERTGRKIRDTELVTACQQACPTGAIVFGDLDDPEARVNRWKQDPRAYRVLEELNTRPRTSHLARVRNPNPEIEDHG